MSTDVKVLAAQLDQLFRQRHTQRDVELLLARALAAREAAVREAIAAWHDAEAHSFAVANAGQWVTAYRKRMTFLLHRLHQRCAAAIRAQGGGA